MLFWADGIIGTFSFEDVMEKTNDVNVERYKEMK